MRAEAGPEIYLGIIHIMATFILLGGNKFPKESLEKEEKTEEDMTILSGEFCYFVNKRMRIREEWSDIRKNQDGAGFCIPLQKRVSRKSSDQWYQVLPEHQGE